MENSKFQECVICSEERSAGQVWFLVAESHWEDKLKVLEWQDALSRRRGIYAACCGGHVEELVVHWMTAGSLDYPFATVGRRLETRRQRLGWILPVEEPDTRGAPADWGIGSRPGERAACAQRRSEFVASDSGRVAACVETRDRGNPGAA
jgi:hypothetical protein